MSRLLSLITSLALSLPALAQEKPAAAAPAEKAPAAEQAGAAKKAADIVAAARAQVGKTLVYDPAYVALAYPGGDVPVERGVCTDVVIRALRACGTDLQKAVHEDMKAAFSVYPKIWGLKSTDRNIDHRRVPNLAKFFERKGKSLPVSKNPADWLPGDFVVCRLSNGLIHIMIVSDRKTEEGVPLVIHNIGAGAQEEDRLFSFSIEGRYRWFPAEK